MSKSSISSSFDSEPTTVIGRRGFLLFLLLLDIGERLRRIEMILS
jgi:hypothetical protein